MDTYTWYVDERGFVCHRSRATHLLVIYEDLGALGNDPRNLTRSYFMVPL